MIRVAQSNQPDRTPWRPDPATRLQRGRWMTLAALFLAAIAVAAGSAPRGAFYTLAYGTLILVPFWLVPYSVGAIHAWSAWRREPGPELLRPLRWWLAPLLIAPIALGLALSGLPSRAALAWARPGLAELLDEAAQLPEHQTKLAPRFVGPWPAVNIYRYAGGHLRLELEGAANGAGDRGLCFCPGGEPLPGRYADAELTDLGGEWYAWFKSEPR